MREKLYYTLKVTFGKVAERLKALVLKTSEVLKPPWVRIPPFPPIVFRIRCAQQNSQVHFEQHGEVLKLAEEAPLLRA